MAFLETSAPVNACFQVKCDKCGKTTWKVRRDLQRQFPHIAPGN